jgi:aminoglycoside 6'-N-acetyltransferase I
VIRKAERTDLPELGALGALLWPHHIAEELTAEFEKIMSMGESAFFLARSGGQAVGFAQCQLRHDYVEGTSSSPVGYLEGIFVREEFRHQGIAKRLLSACENWAKEQNCREFASDCELDNRESLRFHLGLGFEEANRIICFAKKL